METLEGIAGFAFLSMVVVVGAISIGGFIFGMNIAAFFMGH